MRKKSLRELAVWNIYHPVCRQLCLAPRKTSILQANPPNQNNMKPSKHLTVLACLAGALSTGAQAALIPNLGDEFVVPTAQRLAGWNDFEDTGADVTTNDAFYTKTKFLTKSLLDGATGYGTVGTNGNDEGVFGFSDWTGPSETLTPGVFNGAVNLAADSGSNVFTLTNDTAPSTLIGYLLFDLQKSTGTSASIKINKNGSLVDTISAGTSSVDYGDYVYDLTSLSIWLAPGDSVSFEFLLGGINPARLDNFAIVSAIPEPGSMLAIGCFLGSGLLIRRNRRNVA
jgi:hypothetical protein